MNTQKAVTQTVEALERLEADAYNETQEFQRLVAEFEETAKFTPNVRKTLCHAFQAKMAASMIRNCT